MAALGLLFVMLFSICCLAEAGSSRTLADQELYEFFANTLFIGDSITRQLRTRVLSERKNTPDFFADARFLTADSLMLYNVSRHKLPQNGASLLLSGRAVTLYEAVEHYKPSYLFILLGVNDYIGEKIEKGMGYVTTIVKGVRDCSPETKIVFFSLTPLTKRFSKKRDLQKLWDKYNLALEEKCAKLQVFYLDIATPLKGKDGFLPLSYSSDQEFHLNRSGLQIWIETLLDFADEQYNAGLWRPEDAFAVREE